ncbi:hypothetical protein ACOBV8_18865 (plasmid) [Pseudoalteromonas espejiana]
MPIAAIRCMISEMCPLTALFTAATSALLVAQYLAPKTQQHLH